MGERNRTMTISKDGVIQLIETRRDAVLESNGLSELSSDATKVVQHKWVNGIYEDLIEYIKTYA